MIIGCFNTVCLRADSESGESLSKASASTDGMLRDTTSSNVPAAVSDSCSSQIHIFMNPGSGGKKGAALSKAGIDGIQLLIEGQHVLIQVWDIRTGESGQKPGFQSISSHLQSSHCDAKIRIIAAGGDGTVIWTVSEAMAHKLDLSRVFFGTIPYGTGNDFSNSFGWGVSPPHNLLSHNMKELRELAKMWLQAETRSHDLWDIEVYLNPKGGRILQQDGKRKERKNPGPTFRKKMGNYFSFGPESKIGYDFDKRRTKSRGANKLVYALSGVKRLGRKNPKLADIVEKCFEGDKVLFSADASSDGSPQLVGDPMSLIFLNIKSFAGGLDLWPISKKPGIKGMESDIFDDQHSGDGKLEILSYQSFGAFAAEQFRFHWSSGNGHRIAQTRGPLKLVFKSSSKVKKIYMQIDGEYYAVEGLREISITHGVTVQVLFKKK